MRTTTVIQIDTVQSFLDPGFGMGWNVADRNLHGTANIAMIKHEDNSQQKYAKVRFCRQKWGNQRMCAGVGLLKLDVWRFDLSIIGLQLTEIASKYHGSSCRKMAAQWGICYK